MSALSTAPSQDAFTFKSCPPTLPAVSLSSTPGIGNLPSLQTGTLKGGPADVNAGREIESSDTNLAMDPSEKSNLDRREGSGQEVSFPLTGEVVTGLWSLALLVQSFIPAVCLQRSFCWVGLAVVLKCSHN